MTIDPRVQALCDEFDVRIVPRSIYPQPGETRAVAAIARVIKMHGMEHARLVMTVLVEGKGNAALIDYASIGAVSDIILACSDLVEADAGAFLEMFDRMPLGPLMAIAHELRGIVHQRSALAGMLFLQLRKMRQVADQKASADKVRRANESELDKGRNVFDPSVGSRRLTAAGRVALGRDLLAKKASLPFGEWGPWLLEQPFSVPFALKCMRLAREEATEAKAA